MFWPSCPLCQVQADCGGDLSGRPVQTDLSGLSCPIDTPVVMSKLSRPDYNVMAVSCYGCPGFPGPVVLAQLSCPCCPLFLVLLVLSEQSSLVVLSWMLCPGLSLSAVCLSVVLSQLSFPSTLVPSFFIPAVLFAILSWLSRSVFTWLV